MPSLRCWVSIVLRISELLGLRREDVADAGDARLDSGFASTALRIRKAKTGRNQFVTIDDPAVRQLVRELVAATDPGQPLFPSTPPQFRARFKHVCAELSLSPAYVPHSLRHGGATRMHMSGAKLEDVLMRGRWESTKSARRYVQAGRAILLSVSVPTWVADSGRALARNVVTLLSLSQLH